MVPTPPEAGAELPSNTLQTVPQLVCEPVMVPPSVTLQHGTTATVVLQLAEQVFASVTTTEYVPAANPDIAAVVAPLLHKYEPALPLTLALPKLLFEQVPSTLEHVIDGMALIITLTIFVSPGKFEQLVLLAQRM